MKDTPPESFQGNRTKVTKFYNTLRQQLRSQFREIYKRCTCTMVDGLVKKSRPHRPHRPHHTEDEVSFNKTLDEDYNNNKHEGTTKLLQTESLSCACSVNELDVCKKSNLEAQAEFILPSPPPTPRAGIVDRKNDNRPNGDGDGDYFFQVIAPPSPFQDNSTSYFHPPTYKHSHSRPYSALQGTHYVGTGDISTACGHIMSDSSVISINRDEEHQFQPTTPSSRSYCTYSKLVWRPGSGFKHQTIIQTQMGTCNLTHSKTKRQLSPNTFVGRQTFRAPAVPKRLEARMSYIHWKDIPKRYVEVIFIPTWSNQLLKRVPCFSYVEKLINWMAIAERHEKVAVRRERQLELQQRKQNFKNNLWCSRRQIGLKSRQLQMDSREQFANIHNDSSGRFQFIHWLNEDSNSKQVDSIGRFFDIQERRMVTIKIAGDKATDCPLGQVKLKLGAVNEISCLIQMDHINIVQIFTYFSLRGKIHLVLDGACDHSLRCEILCASKGVNPKMAHGVIYQILNGLAHCHNNGCLHCDLCPENILVTVEGIVKVANFSKSIFLTLPTTSLQLERDPVVAGNVTYGAPELLAKDTRYGISADSWSIGCILIELLRGHVLWDGESPEEQLVLIHQTVGPLLPRHCQTTLIDENIACKTLNDHLPTVFDDVISFIENCLEVDPSKRSTCEELLQHRYIKQGSSITIENLDGMRTAEEILPRMALWELRPHTAPLVKIPPNDVSPSNSIEEPKQAHLNVTTPDLSDDNEIVDPYFHSFSPTRTLRTKTAVKKSRASVLFSAEPVLMMDRSTYDSHFMTSSARVCCTSSQNPQIQDSYKTLWNSLQDVSAPKALSKSMQACTMTTKRLPRQGKMMEGRKLNNVDATSNCSDGLECFESESSLPLSPRVRMQYIINVLPAANWNTVQMFTTQLLQIERNNPKTFSAYIGSLITVLLDQITKCPKVSGPAIRILNNICKSEVKYFEREAWLAERIIESMLNKLGGPSFIEKESNQVLRHLVKALKPAKTIVILIKFGAHHKTSAARLSSIILIDEALKNLELLSSFGLPGEQSAVQRKFSSGIFHMATRSLTDSNAQTRIAARDIYQQLMRHPHFWYLYQTSVPQEKRQWVNRLLDEIRRCQDLEKKNVTSILGKNSLII